MINPELVCKKCFSHLNEPQGVCPHCGFDNASCENAANQLDCGSILAGTYLVGCALGQGGFGITYIGLDLNLNLKVAIKEYYPEGYATRDGRTHTSVHPLPGERKTLFERGKEKFVSEAQILARFSEDPSIVGVRGYFQENGTAYIVMNFVEGETLKAYAARRGGKLPAAEVLKMMEPLFASLSRVHAAGLLHRDISPDNIMRRSDGSVVLLDFGAARQMSIEGEHSNTINVKHGFAPEEQYRTHGEQGPWTDVYALCATIYRLTTGVTPQQALDRIIGDIPLAPPNRLGADFTMGQQQAILHGLALRAERRTRTIAQLQSELKEEPVPAAKAGVTETRPSQPKKKPGQAPINLPGTKRSNNSPLWLTLFGVAMALVILAILFTNNQWETAAPAQASNETAASGTAAEREPSSQPTSAPTSMPTAAPRIFAPVGTFVEGRLAAGSDYSLVLLDDGTVRCFGGMTSGVYDDVQTWKNIVYISGYDNHAVGLRKDGTLVPAGTNERGELEVRDLKNVTQVITGYLHTVALTADGKVHYIGYNKHGRADCEKWTSVKKLLGGDDHLAVIFNDGSMAAVGYNADGQCDLKDVVDAIGGTVSSGTTYVLHEDKTVEPFGKDWHGEDDVRGWSDIIYVDGGDEHTVGLRSDGTVEVAGENTNLQYEVLNWENIVAICAGQFHTIGIDTYGVIHITGPAGAGYRSGDGESIWQQWQ